MIREGSIIENEIREKIIKVEEEYNVKLSITQKILLTIRGPITNVLDILYGEVHLFMLDQHFEKADERISNLVDISQGDEIDYREVIVHKNGHPLVYALSYIPTSRCSKEILEDLKNETLTTGKIIDKHENETIRIIDKIYIENPTPMLKELFKTNEEMLCREYVMVHDDNYQKKVDFYRKVTYNII